MIRIYVLLLLIFAVAQLLMAQQQNEPKMPDEQIIVHKKFNDKGDLIGYDSTAIYTLKTDTAFSFGFSDDSLLQQWNFPGIEQFMDQFRNDSIFGNLPFQNHPFTFGFRLSPFNDQFKDLGQSSVPESLFADEFPFHFDSLFFNFNLDPAQNFNHEFPQKFMKDLEERINRHFFNPDRSDFPNFDNEKQQQEWEQLMKKHRHEIENLKQKWQNQQQSE